MDKEEFKQQIRTITVIIEDNERYLSLNRERLAILQSGLAEAEKPKLRHGDYAYASDGGASRLYINMKGGIVWCDDEKIVDSRICGDNIIIGNIFDDLTELAKPLPYFKADVHEYAFDFSNFPEVPVQIAGNWHTLKEAKEISMKIQRVIHTAEQEQAKNKD